MSVSLAEVILLLAVHVQTLAHLQVFGCNIVSIHNGLMILELCSCVYHVILKWWIGCNGAAFQQTGTSQNLRAMTYRCDWFLRTVDLSDKLQDVRIRSQILGMIHQESRLHHTLKRMRQQSPYLSYRRPFLLYL